MIENINFLFIASANESTMIKSMRSSLSSSGKAYNELTETSRTYNFQRKPAQLHHFNLL